MIWIVAEGCSNICFLLISVEGGASSLDYQFRQRMYVTPLMVCLLMPVKRKTGRTLIGCEETGQTCPGLREITPLSASLNS
jgi:hypothetical protein